MTMVKDAIKQLNMQAEVHRQQRNKRPSDDNLDNSSTSSYQSKIRRIGTKQTLQQTKTCASTIQIAVCQSELNRHCFKEYDISYEDVAVMHREFIGRARSGKQWLLDQAALRETGKRRFFVSMSREQERSHVAVCNRCFALMYGLSLSTVDRAIRKAKDGEVNILPAEPREKSPSYFAAVVWMKDTIHMFGDYMPDRRSVVLPVISRHELFAWYATDNAIHGPADPRPYKYDAFIKLLAVDFPYVEFRRHKRFTQCQLCNKFDKSTAKERVIIYTLFTVQSFVCTFSATIVPMLI